MFTGSVSPIFPVAGFAAGGGAPSGPYRDLVWVDLHVGPGGSGNEQNPFNTAGLGLSAVPDGGTLILMGGDASLAPGVTIAARSLNAFGFSGQKAAGGQTPVLPTLTYAITTGTQRLAFRNISVALVHSGTVASLSEFYFEFCPSVTLTAGGDASPVYWVGAPGNIFSGSGGAAQFIGGTIAGYVANGGGTVAAAGSLITSDITSSSTITLTAGCTFGGALSITAPTINVDITTLHNATIAGVTFSTTVHLLAVFGTPSDIGTANSTGTATTLLPSDHVHRITFTPLNAALATANATININGQKITGGAAPTSGSDYVTKTYADAIAVGLKVKTPAVAVATANQATLSGTAQTIDGVVLNTIGQRVLFTAQTTATQNGLWVVASGAWTRPTDFLTGSGAAQSYVLVTGGTLNAGSSYFCTNATGSDVVDTASLTWVLFSQAAVVNAGAGMTKTGNTLDVIAGDATIVVHADDIVVGVIGNSNLADNTIALGRLVNASAQNHFLMRKSASGGAWEDGTAADAKTALGIFGNPSTLTVRAATTANITLSGTQTVDGVVLVAGDRCLVKNQTTASQNGIYVVASGAWARSSDASSTGQLFGGLTVHISEGTANGNQVAMLTTDDPITIGTTALTFSMGRVSALGAVAPLDITNGAPQIGTSTLGTPIDHVHAIGFTVLAAVLAVASTAISVNSQKIANLGAPTLSTDAARLADVTAAVAGWVAPANPGDNGKIAYANAGALAYATNIKTDGTRYQFGTTGTGGLLNFAQSSNIAFGANNAGTQVVPLVRWGSPSPVALVDGLYIGSTSGDAGKVAAMRFGVDTGATFQWEVNGAAVGTLNSQGQTVTPAATTGTVASALRVTDAAHTALTLSTERISVLFDLGQTRQWATGALATERAMRVVAPTIAFVGASTVTTAATVAISGAPAAGTNATVTNSFALWIESGAIGFGSGAALTQSLRLSNNTGAATRNAAGNGDLLLIKSDASNGLVIGDTNNAGVYVDTGSAGAHHFRYDGVNDVYSFSSTIANFRGASIQFTTASAGSTAVAGVGLQRITGSPGNIIAARSFDNTGDINVISLSGNGTTFNDLNLGDSGTKGNNALYLSAHGFIELVIAGADEYEFFNDAFYVRDNQIRFGSNYSTNALLNFGSNSTIMAAKDGGGTARNLLVWTSGDVFQVGSGNITSVQLQSTPGNTWTFGSTASFPGVGHNIASGGFLSFGTAAASGLVRAPNNATLLAARNVAGSGDLAVLAVGSGDEITLGNTASAMFLNTSSNFEIRGASGCTVIFGAVGGFVGGTGVLNFENNKTIIAVKNAAHSTDIACLAFDNTNRLLVGASNNASTFITGGAIQLANVNTGFFGSAGTAKPTVSGSRTASTGSAAAALTSVITALANLGLVTDGSTP
jgi:hypothetical protein